LGLCDMPDESSGGILVFRRRFWGRSGGSNGASPLRPFGSLEQIQREHRSTD
jgi:hypothetical protein